MSSTHGPSHLPLHSLMIVPRTRQARAAGSGPPMARFKSVLSSENPGRREKGNHCRRRNLEKLCDFIVILLRKQVNILIHCDVIIHDLTHGECRKARLPHSNQLHTHRSDTRPRGTSHCQKKKTRGSQSHNVTRDILVTVSLQRCDAVTSSSNPTDTKLSSSTEASKKTNVLLHKRHLKTPP